MKRRSPNLRLVSNLCTIIIGLLAASPGLLLAQPSPPATSAFNSYVATVESRLARQHGSPDTFLAPIGTAPNGEVSLHRGQLIVEQLTPAGGAASPGALLHHWRGTAFVPGGKAADFERLMRDFNAYPQHFSPQVLRASVLTQHGDHLEAAMRVRQKHVITVVMDTAYDITFARFDAQHGSSISRSTRISEIDSPGTVFERALSSSEEHGFLWRLNTYWSYEERDGGLYIQVEVRLADAFDPTRPRLGGSALRRERSSRFTRIHPALHLQRTAQIDRSRNFNLKGNDMKSRSAGKNSFRRNRRIASHSMLLLAIGLLAGIASAQTQTATPANAPVSSGAYDWFGRAGWVCAVGASTSSVATKPTAQCGGILSGPLFDLEAGVMGPQAGKSAVSAYLSTNLWIPLIPFSRFGDAHGMPLAVGGYTRMFQTGNALDYGVAYAHAVDSSHSVQLEARDYWAFSNPAQHNVVFRVVWLTGLPD